MLPLRSPSPRWFAFPEQKVQIFLPVYHERTPEQMAQVDNHQFIVIGRLKPGVSREQASQEVSAIVRRIHDAHLDLPFMSSGAGMWPLIDYLVRDVKPALYMLLAATGCMLLIACLNVANLLTARSAARRREIAIRTALGGGRFRLIREQLIETLILFFCRRSSRPRSGLRGSPLVRYYADRHGARGVDRH